MTIAKHKFLEVDYFIDNKYLDSYISLIQANISNTEEKGYTQKHHIIPRCYYKLSDNPINNQKSNLVNLTYTDHILAHYYLCLCTQSTLKLRLSNAFFHLVNRKYRYSNFNPETDLEQFAEIYQTYYKSLHRENRECGRPIICIETGQIFKNTSFANDWLGKNRYTSSIWAALTGIQKSSGGYHWAYADDRSAIEKLSLKYFGQAKLIYSKPIYCFELKKSFDTGGNLIEYFQDVLHVDNIIPYPSTPKLIKSSKHYHFCYLEDLSKVDNCEDLYKISVKRPGKKIICVETGKEYQSIGEAVRLTGISSISAACSGKYETAGSYHWCYSDEYPNIRYKNKAKSLPSSAKAVRCVDCDICFYSASEAERWLKGQKRKGTANSIIKCCSGIQRKCGKYTWEFID